MNLGLINKGNSCYVNAVLQSFVTVKSFCKYLKTVPKNSIATSLQDTFQGLDGNKAPFLPRITEVQIIKEQFLRNNDPQDAHEFMQFVLMTMEEQKEKMEHKFENMNVNTKSVGWLKWINQSLFSQKLVNSAALTEYKNCEKYENPFAGLMNSIFFCESCRVGFQTQQRFMDISLPIPPEQSKKLSITDCLDSFMGPEATDNNCKKCDSSQITRNIIVKAPKALCLHLRRLIGSFQKLTTYISFDKELDLKRYVSPMYEEENSCEKVETPKRRFGCKSEVDDVPKRSGFADLEEEANLLRSSVDMSYLYQLVSVVVHTGDHTGGHYSTYRKRFNDWIYVSDEKARIALESEVLASEAYMLCYEKYDTL